jgi:hypothetical protein
LVVVETSSLLTLFHGRLTGMVWTGGNLLVTVGATLLVAAGCKSPAQSPHQSGPGAGAARAEADLLRATERERLRALVAADVPRARELHADDFQLINPLGGALSKEEYLGGIASGQLDYLSWEPDSIAVRLYGDVAVIRYSSHLEIVVRGTHIPRRRYWHTDLYERRGGRWQVVWSHATGIQ